MKTKISICVATKEAAALLPNLLESVKNQKFDSYELLIADACSEDATVDIIEKSSNIVDYYHSISDYGIYDAWNSLLPYVTGTHLIFLGCDDVFSSVESLSELAVCINKYPGKYIYYGDVDVVSSEGVDFTLKALPWSQERRRFIKEMMFGHTGVAHSIEGFNRVGQFNPNYKIAGDYEFLLRIYSAFPKSFHYTGLTLVYMGKGGVSTHPKSKYVASFESLRACYFHLGKISTTLIFRLIKGITRYVMWCLVRILPNNG